MSLADDIFGEQTQQLAVLYCDLNCAEDEAAAHGEDLAWWRLNSFRAGREVAADHGGHEETTGTGGWAATFESTVEALVCAQELASLVSLERAGPSLSGGLSAGEVSRDSFGIGGGPVREAIALCRRAHPGQVLVANPLRVVMARESSGSFDSVPAAALAELRGGAADAGRPAWTRWTELDEPDRAVLRPLEDPVTTATRAAIGYLESRAGAGAGVWQAGIRPASTEAQATAGGYGADFGMERPLRLLRETTPSPPENAPGASLRLSVLGWVQLEDSHHAGRRAVMRGSQARAVLSMLALRRGPVHKDELAELLWPDALPDHWEGALRGLVTKIRRFLEDGGLCGRQVLVGEDGYYELRLPAGVTVDRYDAAALIGQAEVALADHRPSEAAAAVREAVAILEGRLLSGPDNAWFDQIRAELTHDRLAALELWARAELDIGSIEGAKRAAAEALGLDPYRESSYRLLMLAHAAAGSRGEALRTYEQCRRRLADELGVGPSAQTQALYIQLLG